MKKKWYLYHGIQAYHGKSTQRYINILHFCLLRPMTLNLSSKGDYYHTLGKYPHCGEKHTLKYLKRKIKIFLLQSQPLIIPQFFIYFSICHASVFFLKTKNQNVSSQLKCYHMSQQPNTAWPANTGNTTTSHSQEVMSNTYWQQHFLFKSMIIGASVIASLCN